ncbi:MULTISPECIES: hypothetical protein [unclassified Paenibacillus]|nr:MULTISPECIES: hypothetical protein [unclassified Paenibacillus]
MAKSFGVSTAKRLGEALKKCPELVICPSPYEILY